MIETSKLVLLSFILIIISVQICSSELAQMPHLSLSSPDDPSYTEVIIKRVGDNLTLTCEMKGDKTLRLFVWNYVSVNGSSVNRPFSTDSVGPTTASSLQKWDMQLEDSGQYMCSSPPFSVTKFILVQNRGMINCARGAFSCGARCVLPPYVCDGRSDCLEGEDEAPPVCPNSVCQRPEMLNCSDGRCIPSAACCPPGASLCLQPGCCTEHAAYSRAEGLEPEYPALYEDRHAPDDYGFIQSTIYTVTACALIFMIAAVLLVSAICKMHMKRAALRSYARAAAQRHYNAHQAPRFPPCYEASRLLEQEAGRPQPVVTPEAAMQTTPDPPTEEAAVDPNAGFGLSRLGAIFSARYRQVPTECDVEMTAVRPSSVQSSPARNRARLDHYRSPTYCDLNSEYFLNGETGNCGRELNYASDSYRLDQSRRLTLQLGRFQLSLPRFGRDRPDTPNVAEININDLDFLNDTYTLNGRTIRFGRDRPDTPNVAEININDLDFVNDTYTLNGRTIRFGRDRPDTPNVAEININDLDFVNDTYTLNGRTIRLLGGNFENYPRPPPYIPPIMKISGPPPEYLSRDTLNNSETDTDASNNVEMPPRYEDVNSNDEPIERVSVTLNVIREAGESMDSIPNIDDLNANEVE